MKKSKIERISSYAIMLIALSALFVSIWQISVTHKHNKLSVKPYLDYHLIQADSVLTVNISNQGFGPAIIKKITFNHKEKEYSSLEKLLNSTGEIENRLGSYQYSENSVIAAGENKLLVRLRNMKLRGINVSIVYETIYEDRGEFQFQF